MGNQSQRPYSSFLLIPTEEIGDTPLPTINRKRICKYPHCKTILRKTNLDDYCGVHLPEHERAKSSCPGLFKEKAFIALVKYMIKAKRKREMLSLCFDWKWWIKRIINHKCNEIPTY